MGIQYNGVTFAYPYTESVDQRPEMDGSGTDHLFNAITIRTKGVLGPYSLPPALAGEDAGDVALRIRKLLTLPRRRLVYSTPDGTTLIDTSKDDRNGPVPELFGIHQVTEGSFLVDFAVTVRLAECPELPGVKAWLSNRWSETTSYDDRWRCTKRRVGTLILTSRSAIDPDSLRGLVSPPVDKGFRRESAEYTLDETNLVYRYSFVDREMMRPPPFPGTRLTGRMSQHTPLKGGMGQGQIQLKMSGPKGVDKKQMLNALIRIAVNRALAAGATKTPSDRVMVGGAISENLDDDTNEVELSLTFNIAPTPYRELGRADKPSVLTSAVLGALGVAVGGLFAGAGGADAKVNAQGRLENGLSIGFAGWVGKDLPGSDPKRAISIPTRGTAEEVRIVAAALNDACTAAAVPELKTGPLPNQFTGTRNGQTITINTGVPADEFPDDAAALYRNDGPGVMENWEMTSHYTYDPGVVVMASTKTGEKGRKVQLRNPTMELQVDWSASRVGGPPVIPDPRPGNVPLPVNKIAPTQGPDENAVLVGPVVISPASLSLAADGVNVRHTVSGCYRYQFLDPSKVSVAAPVPPFLQSPILGVEANGTVGVVSSEILFPTFQALTNPFTGQGVRRAEGGGIGGANNKLPPLQGGAKVNP